MQFKYQNNGVMHTQENKLFLICGVGKRRKTGGREEMVQVRHINFNNLFI